jgi:hypothetical protein
MTKRTDDAARLSRGERIAQFRRETLIEHFRNVMGTVAGRAVLWHILEQCNLYSTSYDPDANLTIRREGRRDVGLELIAMIEAVNPHGHVELMQQAKAVTAREQEDTSDDRDDDRDD